MMRRLRLFLLGMALLYTVSYGVWRILLLTPWYEQFWQLQLSELLGSWAYLPLLPLIGLAALTRHRNTLIVLLVPLFFFGIEYGRQFLPNWQRAGEAAVTLRVLTWNTLYSGDYSGEFQTLVHQTQPDYVAIQEINLRLVRLFKDDFADDYPYQAVQTAGGTGGLALFSRYPLEIVPAPVRVISCQCLVVASEVAGRPITLIVVHIWRPEIGIDTYGQSPTIDQFSSRFQAPIFDQLLARITAVNGPLIVLGDFNTTERQPNFRRLRQFLDDAFAQAGWGMGYSFPVNLRLRGWSIPPLVRIDHILISKDWRARTVWAGRLSTPDHGYVVADLVLQGY